MQQQVFKIVILGEGRVGKSSIALQFVENKFSDTQQSTVNACCLEKKLTLPTGKNVVLSLWDTAGQEKYSSIAPMYYRDALAAIVVYDITSKESFAKVLKWTSQLREYANPNILIYIVGNKSDMEPLRKIQRSTVQKYCLDNDLKHFDVSAKTGHGIQNMFTLISEQIIKSSEKNSQDITIGKGKKNKFSKKEVDLKAQKPVRAEKVKCC